MCTVYLTSIHALIDLANLQKGQVPNPLSKYMIFTQRR